MRSALHAEWTKLRTQRSTAWVLLAAALAAIAISAAVDATTHVSNAASDGDSTRTSLVGVYLGQLLIATLAILAITEEYATGMIRITFTAMPNRTRVLACKALSLLGPTTAASVVMVAGCLVAGRLLLPTAGLGPAHGYALISLAHNATLRAAAGTAIYLILIALLSLGIATVLRGTAVSIGAVFSLLFLPQILARIVGGAAGRHIEQIAPMTAGLSIEATTKLQSLAIAPWAGLAVSAAWTAASLMTAALTLRCGTYFGTRARSA
jgi:ABC-2 type transport system permease protein